MNEIVSRDSDLLVLVDSDDNVIGLRDKLSCHEGRGVLHRAISVFLFDANGRMLLQQRHEDKLLWGGYWSNSCCTHPFHNEPSTTAAKRRVREELGLDVEVDYVYKFEYRAEWGTAYSEHELCSVFVGRVDVDPEVNPTEIQDWRWAEPATLDSTLHEEQSKFTPWLKLEWEELRKRGHPL